MRCRAVLQWGMAESRIFLVRHGQTAWSRTGRHTSRTDVPLEPEGVAQAEAVGRLLVGREFVLVLTSPLERAAETSRLAGFGDRVEDCPDLVEWDYGEYEGLTTAEIQRRRPDWSLFRDGCPGGESVGDVTRRCEALLDSLPLEPGSAGAAALFAHGHVLRALAASYLGLGADAGALFTLDTASVSVLGFERRQRVLCRWNT
jgi:broad specificity phosphatase PhoE